MAATACIETIRNEMAMPRKFSIASGIPFKCCSMCGDLWPRLEDFLADPLVVFIGYQPSWEQLNGFFLFNHARCGTTLSVPQATFAELSPKPELGDSCECYPALEELCLAKKQNKPCPPQCACVYVSHISHIALSWPKEPFV